MWPSLWMVTEDGELNIKNLETQGTKQDLKLQRKLLKSKEISEDDEKKFEKKIQIITDEQIKKIDEKVISKETEIMKI